MKKIILFLVLSPILWAFQCDDNDDVICTTEAKAGLNIIVKDALSGEILSEGVTVIAQEGDYSETLQLLTWDNSAVFLGAWERKGTYDVIVTKDGYQTFTSAPITVTADICHVIPVEFTVEMIPE
jgi:hypothetical protein